MSTDRKILSLVLAALIFPSCSLGDFYDKEYVIYDPAAPAATGSQERTEQDRIAAEAGAGEDSTVTAPGQAEIDRIFVLENLSDELDRAIADQLGDLESLAQKKVDVEREIAWRRAEAGEAYTEARLQRLSRLLSFPVVVR